MISKRRAGIVVILVFFMTIIFSFKMVESAEFDQTRHIQNTDGDLFITEAGIGIDSELLAILDPNMDITAYLYFPDMKINHWEVLHNATLKLRTSNTLSFEADSSVTIYGITDYGFFSSGSAGYGPLMSPSAILSAPLTSHSVTVNTSQFYGPQWWDIDVSEIVRELKDNERFNGPGMDRGEPGDNMAFIIMGAEGYDTRYFFDFKAGNNYEAQLELYWTTSPPPPPGGEFNESYRGINIFEIDLIGENRTGQGFDVNWNLLNVSDISERDAGGRFTVNNDTWITISNLQGQWLDSFYNDTGALDKTSMFARFAVNISDILRIWSGPGPMAGLAGISTHTPVNGGGLADGSMDGSPGEWVGILLQGNEADTHYRFVLSERLGVAKVVSGGSDWVAESGVEMFYCEFAMGGNWISYRIYTDPEFTVPFHDEIQAFTIASGPFRYPQIIGAMGATGQIGGLMGGEYYTYLEMPIENATSWTIAFENGTIIEEDLEDYEAAQELIDDMLGDNPDDPTPAGQGWEETGPFTRFKTRLYIFLMGVGMIWGPIFVFAMKRPTGYAFVVGLFVMVIGLGLIIQAGIV